MVSRLLVIGLVACAVIAGVAVYWLQVYAYYDEVSAAEIGEITLVPQDGGAAEPVAVSDFRGINSDSSPIRFRGCFRLDATPESLAETYVEAENAEPLIAPGWFDCFDAARIGADIENGTARAFLSRRDIHPGVDRVIAVYPDGRAYAWHQLNESAED